MEFTAVANLLGAIGLGAASGLNAWIPLLALGLAERLGVVDLTGRYEQLGSTPVLVACGVLLVIDLIGDKVAVVDHVLHAFGTVVAPVSGAIVFGAQASLLSDTHPWVAAGAGMLLGGSVHAGRSMVRPAVTAGTGGLGNPVISAIEDVLSFGLAVLAILVPVLAFLALLGLVAGAVLLVVRFRRRRAARGVGPPTQVGPKFSQ